MTVSDYFCALIVMCIILVVTKVIIWVKMYSLFTQYFGFKPCFKTECEVEKELRKFAKKYLNKKTDRSLSRFKEAYRAAKKFKYDIGEESQYLK